MKKIYLSFTLFLAISNAANSQVIPANIPTNGLIGYWSFDNNANDLSGKDLHGEAINVIPTEDRFGNKNAAYEFNGKNSRIEINHDFFNLAMPNYTISLWLNTSTLNNPNNQNDSQTLLNSDEHNGIGLGVHGSKNPFGSIYANKFSIAIGSNPSVRNWDLIGKSDNESNSEFKTNEWMHYVLVKKDTFNFSIYLNGNFDKSFIATKNSDTVLTKLVFGALAKKIATFESDECFYGKLDDYAIWNRALDLNEILKVNSETATLSNLKESSFKIYPNPSNGEFSLELKSKTIGHITITDINARKVFESSISPQQTNLNITSQLTKGIYYINLIDEQTQLTSSQKIIIN